MIANTVPATCTEQDGANDAQAYIDQSIAHLTPFVYRLFDADQTSAAVINYCSKLLPDQLRALGANESDLRASLHRIANSLSVNEQGVASSLAAAKHAASFITRPNDECQYAANLPSSLAAMRAAASKIPIVDSGASPDNELSTSASSTDGAIIPTLPTAASAIPSCAGLPSKKTIVKVKTPRRLAKASSDSSGDEVQDCSEITHSTSVRTLSPVTPAASPTPLSVCASLTLSESDHVALADTRLDHSKEAPPAEVLRTDAAPLQQQFNEAMQQAAHGESQFTAAQLFAQEQVIDSSDEELIVSSAQHFQAGNVRTSPPHCQ